MHKLTMMAAARRALSSCVLRAAVRAAGGEAPVIAIRLIPGACMHTHTRTSTRTLSPLHRMTFCTSRVAAARDDRASTEHPAAAAGEVTFASLGVASHVLGRLHARTRTHTHPHTQSGAPETGVDSHPRTPTPIRTPTHIQRLALPVLCGRGDASHPITSHDIRSGAPERPPFDALVHGETGSGKTLAYLLPILSLLTPRTLAGQSGRGHTVAVIVTPTRELAHQVYTVAEELTRPGKHKSGPVARVAKLVGLTSSQTLAALADAPPHVVIGTPTTLARLVGDVINLSHARFIVLDEADELVRNHSVAAVTRIVAAARKYAHPPCVVAVSATPSQGLTQWVRENLRVRGLRTIDAGSTDTHALHEVAHRRPGLRVAPGITHAVLHLKDAKESFDALLRVLRGVQPGAALVFVNSSASLDAAEAFLSSRGIKVGVLGNAYANKQRNSAIEGINAGRLHVIVSTEMAARGLDIPALTHVINFDLPHNAREYIHRVGRVGRLSSRAAGTAISFACGDDELARLVRLATDLRVPLRELRVADGSTSMDTVLYAPALPRLDDAASANVVPHADASVTAA